MSFILQFISKYANAGIILFGLIIAVLLLKNGISLSNQKSRIEEALKRRNNKYLKNSSTKEIEEIEDQDSTITPDTIRKFEMDFNEKCAAHSVLVQCIPIFPLLGILGTVAGLMLEVQSSNLEGMMSSLDVALETTFWGLVFAILLKVIEALFPSKVIYDVEVMLDDFDKKLDIAEMFQKYKDEK